MPSITLELPPMEAKTVDDLPQGTGWQFEPKYDGFRCLAHRKADGVRLQSKNLKPLGRYFPELMAELEKVPRRGWVLDGEIVIPRGGFEALQLRLHPAASRVERLAREQPARLVAFDLLASHGKPLLDRPLSERRAALEALVREARGVRATAPLLGKATQKAATARGWIGREGLDGIVAKRLDEPYQPGKRAMLKIKQWRSFDCVVAGLYLRKGSDEIEHLLLGLYGEDGQLHYVGRARPGDRAAEAREKVQPLLDGEGFTGRAPGAPSRWTREARRPVPLQPRLVAEVSTDHVTGDHMRHGARLLRWRPDKDPRSCSMDQIRSS